MGYAFVSYSSKNKEYADAIKNILNKNGIEIWMAPESIPAGSKYAAEITKAIRNCSCLILVLSNFSQESDAVDGEVELAKLTFKKPIVTIQIEDVELNDSFLFYLKNTHTVSLYEIEEKSNAMDSVLFAIEKYTGKQPIQVDSKNHSNANKSNENHVIELTVHSPVSTDVYLNNKKHPIMRIDLNSGFDYKYNSINVTGDFELIFSAKGFEKTVAFEAVGNRIDYNLDAILTQKEIIASYEREEALEQILYEPTGYAFKQLAVVGLAEDISILKRIFHELNSDETDDLHKDYLLAQCAFALGTLAIKYNDFESAREIPSAYEKYTSKNTYGYIFEKVMKRLNKGLDDAIEKKKTFSMEWIESIFENALKEDSKESLNAIDTNNKKDTIGMSDGNYYDFINNLFETSDQANIEKKAQDAISREANKDEDKELLKEIEASIKAYEEERKLKESEDKELLKEIEASIKAYEEEKKLKESIVIQTSNKCAYTIHPNEILFIEIGNRKSVVYLIEGRIETNYLIDYWKEVLDWNMFAQPHNTFIVNLNYVSEVTKDEVKVKYNNLVYSVDISLRKIGAFKKAFLKFNEQ